MTAKLPPVLLVDDPTVASAVDLNDLILAVEAAFAAYASGRALKPELSHVEADGGEFHIKAGGIPGRDCAYFACKVGAGFFRNRSRWGLPNIIGLVMLCDASTGVPLAVMDSSLLTRLRTGAATAVAAKHLARSNSQAVLVCGAGAQAEIQLRSLLRVLPLKKAFVWTRSDPSVFAHRMAAELQIDVQPALDLREAARASDVIVTCTPARTWFLGRDHVAEGTFIAAVGADSPGKQELEPELVAQSSVVCDITQQCVEVGELQYCSPEERINRRHVRGELGGVIIGQVPARQDSNEIIIFDSTGTALQDVAAAALIYERCRSLGRGQAFSFRP